MKNELLLIWALEIIVIIFSMAALVYLFTLFIDTYVSVLNDSVTIYKSHAVK
jgi:uncharacterized membrane protein